MVWLPHTSYGRIGGERSETNIWEKILILAFQKVKNMRVRVRMCMCMCMYMYMYMCMCERVRVRMRVYKGIINIEYSSPTTDFDELLEFTMPFVAP